MECCFSALQIMMLNNGCMCCTVKEDLLKMLFELVSGLVAVLCLACLRANLLPLCLHHVCLLLARGGLNSMQLHPASCILAVGLPCHHWVCL